MGIEAVEQFEALGLGERKKPRIPVLSAGIFYMWAGAVI